MSSSFCVLLSCTEDFMRPLRGSELQSALIGQTLLQRSELIKMPAGLWLSILAEMSGKPLIQGTFPSVVSIIFKGNLKSREGTQDDLQMFLFLLKVHLLLSNISK